MKDQRDWGKKIYTLNKKKVTTTCDDHDSHKNKGSSSPGGGDIKKRKRILVYRNLKMMIVLEMRVRLAVYVFGRGTPIQGYAELSRMVVRNAAGLPLTTRVLGTFLCGKTDIEWIDALERLKTIPLKETLDILELSYISLEEDYKKIFLDVACLLKGWPKDAAIRVIESYGFHARNGLRVLEQKSLIAIIHNEYLGMHDHIEEMGKNIVCRSHPNKPCKHSRLWIEKEIKDVLVNDLGTEATRCIKLSMSNITPLIVMKGLENMKELRYLDMGSGGNDPPFGFLKHGHASQYLSLSRCYGKFDEVSQYLPNTLRILCWKSYPLLCFPKFVGLEMPYSKIVQLWEGEEIEVLNELRFLDLRGSMLRTCGLEMTPNLETLNLRGCRDLVELHMPVGCLNLRSLDLSHSTVRTLDLALTPNSREYDAGSSFSFLSVDSVATVTVFVYLVSSVMFIAMASSRRIVSILATGAKTSSKSIPCSSGSNSLVFSYRSFIVLKPLTVHAGQQVAPEILAAHNAWIKGSKEIQAEHELLQTTRDFHSCRQEEGQSVSLYVLKMKSYIDNLERSGHPVTLGLGEKENLKKDKNGRRGETGKSQKQLQ
nr:hypothetical protein [Tanacetum cinerariifolium]